MHAFRKKVSAGNFGGSAVRRPVGNDSAATMSKLVALLPNYTQIVQNWSKKGVHVVMSPLGALVTFGLHTGQDPTSRDKNSDKAMPKLQ